MRQRVTGVICLLLALCVFGTSGCVSFRKKFVRKSKTEESPELFLELKKYDDAPTEELFHSHYSYVKGWLEELAQMLRDNGNKKRMKKSIDAAIESFAQINAYMNEQGKARLKPLYDRMIAMREKLNDPFKVNVGSTGSLLREVESMIFDFKKLCVYSDVYPFFADRDKAEQPAKG